MNSLEVINTADGDYEQRLSLEDENHIPSWINVPLLQGIEDAELLGQRRKSIECSSTSVRIVGSEIVKEKSPYVVYVIQVISAATSWQIKRRYTDFVYLHSQVKKACQQDLKLPSLPPKKFIGSSLDQAFIDHRAKSLQEYMVELLKLDFVWIRSDFVRFLDNENNSLLFVWNIERMKKMQDMLNTMSTDNKSKEEKLSSELISAKDQVQELQDRIARMEMLFLQHATGVATSPFPVSAIRSLSGSGGMGIDDSDESNILPRFRGCSELDGDNHILGRDNDAASDIDRTLEAAILEQASQGTISSEQVKKVLDLASSKELDKKSISPEFLRHRSSDELKSLAMSLQLQEAVRLSEKLLENKYVDLPLSGELGITPRREQEGNNSVFHCHMELLNEVDKLINTLVPSSRIAELREAVLDYVKGVSLVTLKALVFPVGIFTRESFSPVGDMDVTLCLPSIQFNRWYFKINEALCTSTIINATDEGKQRLTVSNVSFLNTNLKIVKCVIGGVSVNISANQIRLLLQQLFLEKLNDFVRNDNLFKKSLLLLKAWLYFESPRYLSSVDSVFGETPGLLSSWAVSCMLVHIFNRYGTNITHPLHAVGTFFEYYASLDWTISAVRVNGLSAADDPSEQSLNVESFFPEDIFEGFRSRMSNVTAAAFQDQAVKENAGENIETLDDEEKPSENTSVYHPTISCFHRNAVVYTKMSINVLDPFEPTLNLSNNVDSAAIIGAFIGGADAFKSLSATTEDHSVVKSLFDFTHVYLKANAKEVLDKEKALSFFDSTADELESSIEIMELILASVPSSGALTRLIAYILQQRGPLPVGEIGKQLLEFTGSDLLVKNIKLKFGGLKKVVEMHEDLFLLGSDHPFNPLVSLVSDNEMPIPFPIASKAPESPTRGGDSFLLQTKSNSLKESKEKENGKKESRVNPQIPVEDLDPVIATANSSASPRKSQSHQHRKQKGNAFFFNQSRSHGRHPLLQQQYNEAILYQQHPNHSVQYPLYGFQPPFGVPPMNYPVMYAVGPQDYMVSHPPPGQIYYNAPHAPTGPPKAP